MNPAISPPLGLRHRRTAWLILLLALLPAVSYFWQNRDVPHFGSRQDDAVYTTTAKAVATGQGYRLTFLPGEPFLNKYPPIYPLVLASLWRINPDFPNNLGLLVAWNLLPLTALVIGLWRLYQQLGFPPTTAAMLTFALGCLPLYIFLAASVMTECTFLAIFIWTFVLLEEETLGYAAAAGLLASLAYLTRTAAAPLFLTAPLCFALRHKFKSAAAFLAAALPLPALWQVWIALHKSPAATDWVTRFYTDYASMERLTVGFDTLPVVLWENVDSILTGIGELFVFGLGHDSAVGHQVARLLAVAAFAGSFRLVRNCRKWQFASFAAVFTILMCFWHYPPDQRLFAHLAPLFVAGLWTETFNLWTMAGQVYRRAKPGDRPIAVVFRIGLASLGLWIIYSTVQTRLVDLPAMMEQSRADTVSLRKAFAHVAEATPKDSIILSDEDALLYLYTGRHAYRTIVPPRLFYPVRMDAVRDAFIALPEAASGAWSHVFLSHVDWLHTLGDQADREIIRKRVAQRTDLTPVWSNSGDILYRRNTPVAAQISSSGW